MFCDKTQLKLIAGNGGDGCVSFRREKFVPKGGPDGGDGGKGGDIIFKVNPHLNTLSNLNARKIYKADKGTNGKGKNMHGKNADNLILEVPQGTIIFNLDKSQTLADLSKAGESAVIAKGGKGGLGNARFTSSTHQAPRFAENGEPGEETEVILELKLVADVGIIGLPSAGKSTLISVISNARPKIAAYHFTTLVPNLGVVSMAKFGGSANDSFVVADIPGLIEGASEGKGLGHQFLKHIARTKLLIHLIDGSEPNIDQNYKTIRTELSSFSKELTKKPEIIVINKTDLLTEKPKTKLKADFIISAFTKKGLQPLIFEIIKQLQQIKAAQIAAAKATKTEPEIPVIRPRAEQSKFTIDKIKSTKTRNVFYVSGPRIDQLVQMTDLNNLEGLERIYNYMDSVGIQKQLEKKGIRLGDAIRVKEKDIPYRP